MLKYIGPTTSHFTEGKQYEIIRAFDHTHLGPVFEVKNDRGSLTLVTDQNKSFEIE